MQQTPTAPGAEALFEQAIALFTAGHLQEAGEMCRTVLEQKPNYPHALHMLALVQEEEGDLKGALSLARQALDTGIQHPAIHLSYAKLLLRLGRNAEATAPLRASLHLDSRQPQAAALLAKTLMRLGRPREAREILDLALAVMPADAMLLEASGVVEMAQGRHEEARRDFERALLADPRMVEAHSNLALVFEQTNRLDEVRRLLESGLARWPDQVSLRFIAARLQRRDGDAAGARASLQGLLGHPDTNRLLERDVEYELGWCADALGESATAMAHFEQANAKALRLAEPVPGLAGFFPRQLDTLGRFYDGDKLPPMGVPQKPMPAFLLSFPRSGTTLLDTMLGAHPELTVLEEQPTVQAMLDAFLDWGFAYAEDLDRLDAGRCAELRSVYQRAARRTGWDGARGLIDKSPFATAHLGLIQQVFPGAPVIFLARHPCDVALSCFMNNFAINSGTVHFVRLADAVKLYCGVMDLWQLYLRKLPMQYRVLRYEDLVADPEGQLKRLLEFLMVPWSPAVLEHARHARERGRIPTPSYDQVSRPLYQDARDRWRRYRAWLEPHLGELAPYIEAFGYEP